MVFERWKSFTFEKNEETRLWFTFLVNVNKIFKKVSLFKTFFECGFKPYLYVDLKLTTFLQMQARQAMVYFNLINFSFINTLYVFEMVEQKLYL